MNRILLALLFFAGAQTLAAQDIEIKIGLAGGAHSPDLEKKFRNDTLFGAFLGGGAAFDTPWQEKSAGGLATSVALRFHPWLVESDLFIVASEPHYSTLSAVSGSSSGTAFSITQFSHVSVLDLVRSSNSLRGGYTLTRGAPGHEITALGGLRHMLIRADFDTLTFGSVTVGTASAPLIGKSLEATSSGSGLGPEFGAEYAYNFDFGGRLSFRGLLYSASGRWQYKRINVTAASTSGSGLWREEDGKYHVAGRSAMLGYSHPVTEKVRLFINILSETSQTRDLRVKLFRLPVPVATSDFSALLLDTALTRPGSRSTDKVAATTFGVEIHL